MPTGRAGVAVSIGRSPRPIKQIATIRAGAEIPFLRERRHLDQVLTTRAVEDKVRMACVAGNQKAGEQVQVMTATAAALLLHPQKVLDRSILVTERALRLI